jgi:hypothetical protein
MLEHDLFWVLYFYYYMSITGNAVPNEVKHSTDNTNLLEFHENITVINDNMKI